VVVEEEGVKGAIAYSFQMVKANFSPTLIFIAVFSGVPILFSWVIEKIYAMGGGNLELPRKILVTLVSSYGIFLLMAALVYFAVEIKKSSDSGGRSIKSPE